MIERVISDFNYLIFHWNILTDEHEKQNTFTFRTYRMSFENFYKDIKMLCLNDIECNWIEPKGDICERAIYSKSIFPYILRSVKYKIIFVKCARLRLWTHTHAFLFHNTRTLYGFHFSNIHTQFAVYTSIPPRQTRDLNRFVGMNFAKLLFIKRVTGVSWVNNFFHVSQHIKF